MRHDSSFARPRRRALLSCVLALLLALAGCGSSASTSPAGDDKPTITPSGETATPTVTPFIATPASIVGWQTYTDGAYHFKTVIPPGWRIGTVLDNTDPNPTDPKVGGPCVYDVIFFPPGDTHRADTPLVLLHMYRYMVIGVNLNCPPPNDTPNHLPSEGAVRVSISGVPTTLYREGTDAGVQCIAFAPFGAHVYSFYLLGSSDDMPLYLGVLNGFAYLGGK